MEIEQVEQQLDSQFAKYKRGAEIQKVPETDLHLMVLDFDSEVVHKGKDNFSIIHIYAIDDNEKTYYLTVSGFNHYFYAPSPFEKGKIPHKFFSKVQMALNNCFQERPVHSIELAVKEPLLNYKGNKDAKKDFLKITLNNYEMLSKVRAKFENGLVVDKAEFPMVTYESSLLYTLRYMIDMEIRGMSWITVPAHRYAICNPNDKKSSCIEEIEVDYRNITSNSFTDPKWSEIAPLRLMSFDIECKAVKGMPKPEENEVITIGVVCKLHNKKNVTHKVVFQLGECEEIVGTDLYSFSREDHLLQAFDKFMEAYDPDVILGYNMVNFDMDYINKRKAQFDTLDYSYWGRKLGELTTSREGKFNSKAMGFRETLEFNMSGRIQLDMLIHMLREKKLRSYKLNSVCYEFLSEQKEDVHYSIIAELQDGTPATRKRLATYCLQDALLPLNLAEKLKCVYNYVEMARVTGVPIIFLFSRGQQIRVMSQIYRKLRDTDLIIPNLAKTTQRGDLSYQGADVLKPKSGFYTMPIATLDFASLYPSIMISHNFCYSTIVSQSDINALGIKDYHKTPEGYCFVKENVRKGVLPVILEDLISARKKARKELEETKTRLSELIKSGATDSETQAKIQECELMIGVLDSRQLALKISANSVYGFTGAQRGSLPCVEIAASVTSIGRKMIEKTKNYVIEHYTTANGYEFNADVIYGDTDSVMIKFGTENLEEAMRLGKEAAELLSNEFMKPIKLEFEKIYYPYLLLTKKRYAGLYWTNPVKPDKKDCKGVESVRRDNCLLVQIMVDKVLDILLYEQNIDKAINYTKGTIFDLFNNRVDLSMLVITKSLSREVTETETGYKTKTAHAELARRLIQRSGAKFNIGDRIPYVIVSKSKTAKNYDKAEDPEFAFDNKLPLDLEYYLENQIKPPLERIFSVLGDTKVIFNGDHTMVRKGQDVGSSQGLGQFFKVNANACLNCKKPIAADNPETPLCKNCAPKEKEIYLNKTLELKADQREFSRLWSECQRCLGSFTTEVVCSNLDCPIYFRRTKLQQDLLKSYKTHKKFVN